MSTRRVLRAPCATPLSPLAAAVAEPANPAAETGEAYADRQMAAHGVDPSRWSTDALQDAYAHLATSRAYQEHVARIYAELAQRSPKVICATNAGRFAVQMGSCPSGDAALLALCAQLEELQAEWQRLYDATSDDNSDTPADRVFDAYSNDVWPGLCRSPWSSEGRDPADLPARLVDLPATTPEGLRAKAAAILAIDESASYLTDCRNDSMELSLSLIRDVAGATRRPLGAAASPPLRPVPLTT